MQPWAWPLLNTDTLESDKLLSNLVTTPILSSKKIHPKAVLPQNMRVAWSAPVLCHVIPHCLSGGAELVPRQ